MWPASKAIPKELFPLGRVPAIVHLLWEFLDSGIHRVILVVGKQGLPLMETLLDASLLPPQKIANDPLIQRYQRMLTEVEFTILEQSGNYGNGTPLILAAETIGDEPCIYAFGDDVVLGENITKQLISVYSRMDCPVLAAQQVDENRKSLFGILECSTEGGAQHVVRLLEKPLPGQTSSTLASFGRYLVTAELMDDLRNVVPGRDREVWFVDSVIQRISKGQDVCASALTTGKWYTVGDPSSYAEATKAAAEILAL